MKLEERLEKMTGKVWMYNAGTYKILSFQIKSEEVTIVTDKRWIVVPITKINAELEKFLPIEAEKEMPAALMVFENGNKKSLKDIVMDNISKLQSDANYANQAKAINEQVKTMLAMAKLEIETIKLKKDLGI